MGAKYLIRLDDASPTMDKYKWQKMESLLDKFDIKPIVAVIPNNCDKQQFIDEFDPNFWNKVRIWQKKKWTIALHGYDHCYITNDPGIIPFNFDSEFAGVPVEKQIEKLNKAIDIFNREGILTEVFVAPSHSFDLNTLEALKVSTNIRIISDGLAINPYYSDDFFWIPQQLWNYRDMKFGIWTICLHPNVMKETDFEELNKFIQINNNKFTSVEKIKLKRRKKNLMDFMFGKYLIYKINKNRK